MNTYSVSYYPQGFTAPQVITVQASEFVFTDLFVLFMDGGTPKSTVLAIPLDLSPVITRTSTS